jgi:hypothetical protein
MLKALRQIRAAVSLLNPDQVRRLCEMPPEVGLAAATPTGYAAMEDFLLPAPVPHTARLATMAHLHRVDEPGAPEKFDLILCEPGVPCPPGCFLLDLGNAEAGLRQIVRDREELALTLARHFPPFRRLVADAIVQSVCRENALFAVATAVPNIVPNLIELPWAVGEFASDTTFITINQIRMAFMIAAAADIPIGFKEQKAEIASILAGAFGWRAIARELAGKIPMGGGLIPKGAIAYAGTYVIGKGLERLHHAGTRLTREERRQLYSDGFTQGRRLVQGTTEPPPEAAGSGT